MQKKNKAVFGDLSPSASEKSDSCPSSDEESLTVGKKEQSLDDITRQLEGGVPEIEDPPSDQADSPDLQFPDFQLSPNKCKKRKGQKGDKSCLPLDKKAKTKKSNLNKQATLVLKMGNKVIGSTVLDVVSNHF